MKKRSILILICMLVFTSAYFSQAQPADETVTPQEGAAFRVDSNNLYDGMPSTYADGYTPVVKNNTATIILPLVSTGALKNNEITATLGLGDAGSAPFVFKNYEKQFKQSNHKVNNGSGSISSFCVRFNLSLKSSRNNGSYPVIITVRGKDQQNADVIQEFTVYVIISDGKSDEPAVGEVPSGGDVAPPAEEKPTSSPIVIVTNSFTAPETVSSGEEFELNATFKNTSTQKAIQNILIKVRTEERDIQLLENSSSLYFKRIGAGGTLNVKLKYKIGISVEEGRYPVNFDISYDDDQAQKLTAEESVILQVAHPVKVEFVMPVIPKEANAGDTIPITFQIANLGRGAIYNARVEMDVPGLMPSKSGFFGTVEGGMDASSDVNVFVGTKNMNSEAGAADEQYGASSGKAVLIYEDSLGKEHKEEHSINIEIKPQVIASSAAEKDEKGSSAVFWITAAAIAAVIAGVGAYMYVIKKREK